MIYIQMKGKNGMKIYTKKDNQDKKLKELIKLSAHNIKGLISKEIVEIYLPIYIENLKIYINENTIVFERAEMEKVYILEDNNYYSNIEILKNITPIYNIEYKGDDILNLMKYRNKIILMLSESGEIK